MILIVDDHQDTSKLLALHFKLQGHVTVTAESAEVALQILTAQHVDAVILDDYMPDFTGLELIFVLRADDRFAELPLIVFSAGTNEERRQRALSEGASVWLEKSKVDCDFVVKHVDQLLRRAAAA